MTTSKTLFLNSLSLFALPRGGDNAAREERRTSICKDLNLVPVIKQAAMRRAVLAAAARAAGAGGSDGAMAASKSLLRLCPSSFATTAATSAARSSAALRAIERGQSVTTTAAAATTARSALTRRLFSSNNNNPATTSSSSSSSSLSAATTAAAASASAAAASLARSAASRLPPLPPGLLGGGEEAATTSSSSSALRRFASNVAAPAVFASLGAAGCCLAAATFQLEERDEARTRLTKTVIGTLLGLELAKESERPPGFAESWPQPLRSLAARGRNAWSKATTAERAVWGVAAVNVAIFSLWHLPLGPLWRRKVMTVNFVQRLPPGPPPLPHTLLTANFSHSSLWHLAANTVTLLSIGELTARNMDCEYFGVILFPLSVLLKSVELRKSEILSTTT